MGTSEEHLTLFLQMHLPCEKNLEGKAGGRTDQGVSRFGRLIATRVRPDLERIGPIAAVVTSSLPRAVETALLYYKGAGVPILTDERLCAIDYGACEDRPVAELRRIQQDYVTRTFPDGESFSDMAARYRSLLDDLRAAWPGRRLLLIGHNESSPMLGHLCNGLPLGEALAGNTHASPTGRALVEHYAAYVGPYVYGRTGRAQRSDVPA